MGGCTSSPMELDVFVYVRTGDRKGAGTDAHVKMIMFDDTGKASKEFPLACLFKNDFERGKTDTFRAPKLDPQFGATTKIEFWRDNSGMAADWFLDVIVVRDQRLNKHFYFPVKRWIKPDHHYIIHEMDTSLPQNDPLPEARKAELDEKKQLYQLKPKFPGLPSQIIDIPEDEKFSSEYQWDILKKKAKLIVSAKLTHMAAERWEGLEDLSNIYSLDLGTPYGLNRWSNDVFFGLQRVAGCNPVLIKLCQEIPENFGATADMLRPFLEGWTLKQVIDAKRLFIVDLKILEYLPTEDDRPLCSPMALFFTTGEKELVPIAIQLEQELGGDNPVFLPNDPPFTWLLAKMWFNNADAIYHQSLTHLGFTHMIMEGVVAITHRNLSPSHPIFKLLAPHFLFLIAINWRGLDTLVSEGGWVDKTMTVGRAGMFELIRRGTKLWRLDVHGNLPKELETRGVLQPDTLPNYHYRDDAMLLHKAIMTYVKKIVRHYYDTPEKIELDTELQEWRAELTKDRKDGGAGIKGVPGSSSGKFTSQDELILVFSSIIFTCSVQHAASNFPQYDEYAFPPNYPAFLHGEPPRDKLPRTEEDIVSALPDKAHTLDIMVVTKLLSSRGTKELGNFDFQYQYEHDALMAEKEFKEELQSISTTIKERNRDRNPPYNILDPDSVPNSISI